VPFESAGKLLIVSGVFLTVLGLLLIFGQKVPFLGRLPGDIFMEKGNFRFLFPLATCLLLSAVLTIVLNLIIRLFGK